MMLLESFDNILGPVVGPVNLESEKGLGPRTRSAWDTLIRWMDPSVPKQAMDATDGSGRVDLQSSMGKAVQRASNQLLDDPRIVSELVNHYVHMMREHFNRNVTLLLNLDDQSWECEGQGQGFNQRPQNLQNPRSATLLQDSEDIARLAATITRAREHYLYPLQALGLPSAYVERFNRAFSALVWNCLDNSNFYNKFARYLIQYPVHQWGPQQLYVYYSFTHCGMTDEMEKLLAKGLTTEIDRFIRQEYSGVWDRNVLEELEFWCGNTLFPSVCRAVEMQSLDIDMASPDADVDDEDSSLAKDRSSSLSSMSFKFQDLVLEAITELRTSELFNMVIEFPESLHALEDLKTCLKKPSQRAAVVSTFQQQSAQRLSHGGTQTSDIILAYVSTIRAFMVLDPRGVLLDKVSRPIRRYLKERDDTIPLLVSGMLGEQSSELGFLRDELKDTANITVPADNFYDPYWTPDPIDAPADFVQNSLLDVLGALLSLYENKDIFVQKFVETFANRMLKDSECLEEVGLFIGLLKARFGDRGLQNLEVMFKDMYESQRIDTAIHKASGNSSDKLLLSGFHASILSRLFWPKLSSESFNLPIQVEEQFERFADWFNRIKSKRQLTWLKSLGRVTIELSFADRTQEFVVPPIHASVISMFDGPNVAKSIREISAALGITGSSAQSVCSFWVSKQVLRQVDNKDCPVYTAIERLDDLNQAKQQHLHDQQEELSSGVQTAEERSAQEMQIYWSFISNMLTSLDKMPVSRIHSFLKMLVPNENPYTRSQDELEQFLLLKVEEGTLDFVKGEFRLKK